MLISRGLVFTYVGMYYIHLSVYIFFFISSSVIFASTHVFYLLSPSLSSFGAAHISKLARSMCSSPVRARVTIWLLLPGIMVNLVTVELDQLSFCVKRSMWKDLVVWGSRRSANRKGRTGAAPFHWGCPEYFLVFSCALTKLRWRWRNQGWMRASCRRK